MSWSPGQSTPCSPTTPFSCLPVSKVAPVEDQPTINSDGSVRDAQHQAIMAQLLVYQRVRVIMLPLEGIKIRVPDPSDKTCRYHTRPNQRQRLLGESKV